MQIQLIRSATVRLRFGGRTFLIDPWFAAKGEGFSYAGGEMSPLVEMPFPPEQILKDVDAVLISHLHSDHFDAAARSALSRQTPMLCTARDAPAVKAFGFGQVRGIESDTRFGDVRIKLTEGRHGPDEVLEEMGDVSGFLFQAADEPVFYRAGDTILCDEVEEVIATHQPDVIVVHACGADWKGTGPLVMDEAMTEQVLRLAPEAQIVATHLDSVDHATVSRASLRAHFVAFPDLQPRLQIPEDGATMSFENSPITK